MDHMYKKNECHFQTAHRHFSALLINVANHPWFLNCFWLGGYCKLKLMWALLFFMRQLCLFWVIILTAPPPTSEVDLFMKQY